MKSSEKKTRLRLKPADSFDLIRLLARSQHDPRKAVCELVQNSMDAGAGRIDLTWFTEKGSRAIRLLDDGEGVFPELSRPDALRKIATTIGHSHKRSLTPAQRRQLMALGKYGIGLLGFWAVGRVMQIKSRVGGGETWCLTLREDSPDARLERARQKRLDDEATFTQVTILGVHQAVVRQLRPGRLQAYLAGELRGQLLVREVEIRIHDRVARGRAIKEFTVKAQRFPGMHFEDLAKVAVPGYEDARTELYLIPAEEEREGRVMLACCGTTVLDDIAEVDGTGEARAPWNTGRFEGVIDFPDLEVTPGTRRNFQRDEAAAAFLQALGPLEERLRRTLEEDRLRREEEKDRNLARRLVRVFRRITRVLPEYDLFDVRGKGQETGGARSGGSQVQEASAEIPDETRTGDLSDPGEIEGEEDGTFLFPPGPLAGVRISPARSRIPPGATRALKARALDADGRPAAGPVEFRWRLEGRGEITGEGPRVTYAAPDDPEKAAVNLVASQDSIICEARAEIHVIEDLDKDMGIPDPVPVHVQAQPWRSRLLDGVWQYNTGHRDYAAASTTEARRLRYLIHLFAKEVVLKNFGKPADSDLLERMVQVLTYLDESAGIKGK
ncbi:MAG: ATP-binding protein [Planctomycetota bacterium]